MKRILLGATAGAMLASIVIPAGAQIVNFIDTPQRVATYSASVLGLAVASSATDFFTLVGSATMVVRVKHVACNTQGTSTAGSALIQGIVRSSPDLTGTATQPTVVPHDSNDTAGTAVVNAYTVNPGTLGTEVGSSPVRVGFMPETIIASTGPGAALDWDFGKFNDKEIVLRGVAQTFALNANAATIPGTSPKTSCYIEWTESSS